MAQRLTYNHNIYFEKPPAFMSEEIAVFSVIDLFLSGWVSMILQIQRYPIFTNNFGNVLFHFFAVPITWSQSIYLAKQKYLRADKDYILLPFFFTPTRATLMAAGFKLGLIVCIVGLIGTFMTAWMHWMLSFLPLLWKHRNTEKPGITWILKKPVLTSPVITCIVMKFLESMMWKLKKR